MIRIHSNDATEFHLTREEASMSKLLVEMMEETEDDEEDIFLPLVKSKELTHIVAFIKHHVNDPLIPPSCPLISSTSFADNGVLPWDVELMESLSILELFQLKAAVSYMDIPSFTQLIAARIAFLPIGKSLEEMYTMCHFAPISIAAKSTFDVFIDDVAPKMNLTLT